MNFGRRLSMLNFRTRFGRKVDLEQQRDDYRAALGTARSKRSVMPDLAEFCGVGKPFPLDTNALQRAMGRREVWEHIQLYLNFTESEIFAMLKGQPVNG